MDNPKEKKILIVEDEYDIRHLMCLHLQRKGYTLSEAADGSKAFNILKTTPFDLIILDWMLPGMSGLEILSWLRKEKHLHQNTPVLFVTAKSEPENIIIALDTGADDYIIKPFDSGVFLARVNNLIQRHELKRILDSQNKEKKQFTVGDLILDRNRYKVFLKNQEISLTLSEFLLLETLIMNQGKVLSRQQLASCTQGDEVNVTSRTIDTHISVIRKKIGEYGKLIETVRGVGYRIDYIK